MDDLANTKLDKYYCGLALKGNHLDKLARTFETTRNRIDALTPLARNAGSQFGTTEML